MNNPKVTSVVNQIQLILNKQAELDDLIKEMLTSEDLTEASAQYAEQSGKHMLQSVRDLAERGSKTDALLQQAFAVTVYLGLEKTMGPGEWRATATEDAQYRVSPRTIKSLRESHGLALREAKFVVEAFTAGLFK